MKKRRKEKHKRRKEEGKTELSEGDKGDKEVERKVEPRRFHA